MAKVNLREDKVITVGGGTGHFELLNALKTVINPACITAIPGVADNGGSSGRLRSEFGVLPPGDARQCLLALAQEKRQRVLADWLNFRFPKGVSTSDESLHGHNLGNLNIAALEIMYGSQEAALDVLQKILDIPGKVIPISLNKTTLMAQLSSGEVIEGETDIDLRFNNPKYDPKIRIERIYLKESAAITPTAQESIENADWLIISPGDLYSSILPIFLVEGFVTAIKNSKSKIIYCGNLLTKDGETHDFKASDCLSEVLLYMGDRKIDVVLLNEDGSMPQELIEPYAAEGKRLINTDLTRCRELLPKAKFIIKPFVNYIASQGIIRHDREQLAKALSEID